MRENRSISERSGAGGGLPSHAAPIDELVVRWAAIIRRAAARCRIADASFDALEPDLRARLRRVFERYGPTLSRTVGYTYREAISAATDLVNSRRSASTRRVLPIDRPAATRPGHADDSDALNTAILTIQPANRPAVRLHLSGRNAEEIATVMGWSSAKAEKVVTHELSVLRSHLAPRGAAIDTDSLRSSYERLLDGRSPASEPRPGAEQVQTLAEGIYVGNDRASKLEQALADPETAAEFQFFMELAREKPRVTRIPRWLAITTSVALLLGAGTFLEFVGTRVRLPAGEGEVVETVPPAERRFAWIRQEMPQSTGSSSAARMAKSSSTR